MTLFGKLLLAGAALLAAAPAAVAMGGERLLLHCGGKGSPPSPSMESEARACLKEALGLSWSPFRRLATPQLQESMRKKWAMEAWGEGNFKLKGAGESGVEASHLLLAPDPEAPQDILVLYGSPDFGEFQLLRAEETPASRALVKRLKAMCS